MDYYNEDKTVFVSVLVFALYISRYCTLVQLQKIFGKCFLNDTVKDISFIFVFKCQRTIAVYPSNMNLHAQQFINLPSPCQLPHLQRVKHQSTLLASILLHSLLPSLSQGHTTPLMHNTFMISEERSWDCTQTFLSIIFMLNMCNLPKIGCMYPSYHLPNSSCYVWHWMLCVIGLTWCICLQKHHM